MAQAASWVSTQVKEYVVQKMVKEPMKSLSFALFIIGCVAASGHLNVRVLGFVSLGLGSTMLLMQLVLDRVMLSNKKHKAQTLTKLFFTTALALLPVICGALGVMGTLSARQLSWILIGSSISIVAFSFIGKMFLGSCGCAGVCGLGCLAAVAAIPLLGLCYSLTQDGQQAGEDVRVGLDGVREVGGVAREGFAHLRGRVPAHGV